MMLDVKVNAEKLRDKMTSPLKKVIPTVKDDSDELWKKPKSHHGAFNVNFENPWPSAQPPASSKIPDTMAVEREKDVPPEARRIKTVRPDFNRQAGHNEILATWLGHAVGDTTVLLTWEDRSLRRASLSLSVRDVLLNRSKITPTLVPQGVLVQFPRLAEKLRPINILIDPIFAQRASPSDKLGPERWLDAPCKTEDLPPIDLLFISHNHFDHMDAETLKPLIRKKESNTRYVVPLRVGEWFKDQGVPKEKIIEMDWWDEHYFEEDYLTHDLGRIRITCVPAQHHSARAGIDKNATLWAGFVVEQFADRKAGSIAPERTAVYLSGDTGYRAAKEGPTCPIFKQIGERFDHFDFAAIPIWRGGTLSFISGMGLRLNPDALTLAMHATPEDAVCIHREVRSRASMGIHFSTFVGSEDEATYPLFLLEAACKEQEVPNEIGNSGFGVCDIGETLSIPVDGAISTKAA